MLKHYGNILETLTAGALVIGLFQDNPIAVFFGFVFLGIWHKIRKEQVARKGGKGK